MRALLLGAALVHSCTSQRDAVVETPFGDLSPQGGPAQALSAAAAATAGDNRAMVTPCDVLVGADRDATCQPSAYFSQRGAAAFCRNQLTESCEAFDDVIALAPRYRASMWQRGISLYYCERLTEGMEQFELDVTQNPNDTEEMIWHFICNARERAKTVGAARAVAAARAELLHVGAEYRPVMRAAGELYKGVRPLRSLPSLVIYRPIFEKLLVAQTGTEAQLLEMATGGPDSNPYFYTHLYLGLWYEAAGDAAVILQITLSFRLKTGIKCGLYPCFCVETQQDSVENRTRNSTSSRPR